MSEYQYYEFQAIDKPLSQKDQKVLRDISSRAQITSTSFVNEYNYGDLKANPLKLVEKYFDAFLYVTNWGTHQLMLRIPRKLIDLDLASQYCIDNLPFHYVPHLIAIGVVSKGCLVHLHRLRIVAGLNIHGIIKHIGKTYEEA
ncbi:MAG: hypothetical protein D3919_15245, partial [Candidatus Electrothrix sp. AW5]|nr:hypothetical protein [Candidatus Electrothrix gigas]